MLIIIRGGLGGRGPHCPRKKRPTYLIFQKTAHFTKKRPISPKNGPFGDGPLARGQVFYMASSGLIIIIKAKPIIFLLYPQLL